MSLKLKAIRRLSDNGITAVMKPYGVCIDIDGQELEISENEIKFQADMYDEQKSEENDD